MLLKKSVDKKSDDKFDKVKFDSKSDYTSDLMVAKNRQLVTGKILSFLISVDMFAIMLFKGRNQAITDKLVFVGTVLSFANIVMLGDYSVKSSDEKKKLNKKGDIDFEIDNIIKKSSEKHKKFRKLVNEIHLIRKK